MITDIASSISTRQYEITAQFKAVIDQNLEDILAGRTAEMYEIRDVAAIMHIHPTHLSNTVKLTTGNSACFYYENKIMRVAKGMLEDQSMAISEIARRLTYDPSNFTKFFKRFAGMTPKQYREEIFARQRTAESEAITI